MDTNMDEGIPHMARAMLPPGPDSRIPARVDVAFNILRWFESIEESTPKERSVYEAGLEVLRLYLTGEMTFAQPRRQPVETDRFQLWYGKPSVVEVKVSGQ